MNTWYGKDKLPREMTFYASLGGFTAVFGPAGTFIKWTLVFIKWTFQCLFRTPDTPRLLPFFQTSLNSVPLCAPIQPV